ncbi:hypothetical protein NP590_05000, partial [Methylomonas sp. SURF-2]
VYEVAIWSYDKNLLDSINELEMDGVEYGSIVFDDAFSAENITAYINMGAAQINFLAIALPLLVSRKKQEDNKTEIYIRTSEVNIDLKNLVAKYTKQIKIQIIEMSDKKEGK